jgi:sarcosine oxidase subunit alpha
VPLFDRPDDAPRCSFTFDGEAVDAREGDSLATALIDAGLLMTSRSAKYRRPRGPYCLSGDCGTCLLRVDGRPNVRACTTTVAEGMHASSQNTYRPKGLDPTQLVDRVFAGGFDHHHFMVKPKIANTLMQTVARELTGFGELPDVALDAPAEHRHHTPTVSIFGAGPAGRAAAEVLAGRGVDHVLVDRRGPGELGTRDHLHAGLFAAYPGESLWAAGGQDEGTEVLHTFRSPHVVLALGARDPMLPFPNNDVPGVVSARGLLRALKQSGARLAVPCVVVGRGALADDCARRLDAERVDPEDVETVRGGDAVEGLRLRGSKDIVCRLVAVAATPSPASDLAAQAGARLRWDGSGYPVIREESGRCGRFGRDDRTQLWAIGDIAGYKGPEGAALDGERIGKQIATTIENLGGANA